MTLPPLLPHQLWLLALLWPGIVLAGWALACQVTREGRVRALLAPGIAGCLWLVTTHLSGRLLQGYLGAIVTGTVVPGLAGYVFFVWRRIRRPLGPSPAFGRGYSRWMFVGMAVSTALMAPAAWNWCFHDNAGVTAHLALIFEMQRGIYPPRNLTFPRLEMPYHYGFDVAAAYLSALLRVDPERGIDILTLLSWAYSVCLFWGLGEQMYGRRGGVLCAFLTLLGGGLSYYCVDNFRLSSTFAFHILDGCFQDGTLINPPVFAYFFQHPWGIGVPILGLIGVWLATSALDSVFDCVVAVVLLLALDIGQFAAWSATMPILAATLVLAARRSEWRRLVVGLLTLAVVLVIARFMGGFWAHHHSSGFALKMRLGVNGTLASTLLWNLRTFAPFLVGLGGLPFFDRTDRPRVFFALVALGGMLICNLFIYGRSWDIVKFATLSAVGWGVLASGVLVRWFRSRWVIVRMGAVCVLLLAGLSAAGFMLVFDLDLNPGSVSWILGCGSGMFGADRDAADWLRRHMRADDIAYRNPGSSLAYATYAGIGQVWLGNAPALPLPEELIHQRQRLMDELPREPDRYRKEGIRYFVLDGQDGAITDIVWGWEKQGLARERARFGVLRIVEL
jgi:hypothetical protein